jgi:membrane protein implicated in regulation of membrane protease activity
MNRNFLWVAVAVTVIGLFMLVAGIGPLLLPILVTVVGIVLIVVSRRQRR